ncbi:MAG: hypothetical protein ABLQ96_00510 [Candidatus Acidiferrum sp.]
MRFKIGFAACFLLMSFVVPGMRSQDPGLRQGALPWRSPAKLRKNFGKQGGEIVIRGTGVEFRPDKGPPLTWSFLDIQTFAISERRLEIETYQNRSHHVPGMQRYRFALTQDIPSPVAAELARYVERPSQNAVLDPTLTGTENIPAHHRTRTGGTNGALRFGDSGIEYVTSSPGDSRSWRWADLETLSNPAPYTLFVFGYRDTYTFDLKKPLARAVFDHLTDEVYAHGVEIRGVGEPASKRTEN